MLKLEFKNAEVRDSGYGVRVNGQSLDTIISMALGVDTNRGVDFKSNCCNVTVIIDPHPVTTLIETDEEVWSSVEEMEECKREQNESTKKTDPEE